MSEMSNTTKEVRYEGFGNIVTYNYDMVPFDGSKEIKGISREVYERKDSVAVVIRDVKSSDFLFVRQLRPGLFSHENDSDFAIELVAGTLDDPDKDAVETVIAECYEEAGVRVSEDDIAHMKSFYVSPGVTNERCHVFLAVCDIEDHLQYAGLHEHGEDVEVLRLPIEKVVKMLDENILTSAATVIGVQSYIIWSFRNETGIQ